MKAPRALVLLLVASVAIFAVVITTDGRRAVASRAAEPSRFQAPRPSADAALLRPSPDRSISAAVLSVPRHTSVARTVAVASKSSPAPASMAAPSAGTFVGRWVDPQGEPIREGHFQLVPDDPSRKPGYASRAKGYFARGRTSAAVTTDLEGRFRVEELSPGDYLVTEGVERAWRSIDGPFPTDREVLLVTALHRIEVRILDAEGRPLAPEAFEATLVSSVFCEPLSTAAREAAPPTPDRSLAGRALSDGTIVFHVEPESSYRVGYASRSIPIQHQDVLVLAERCCTRVEIRLPPPSSPGELDLAVRTPEGGRLDDGAWPTVTVREVQTGRSMPCGRDGELWASFGLGGFRCELPAGTYDVRVASGSCLVDVLRYTPASRRVEIFAGATTEAEITLGGNGRLELTVAAPPPDPSVLVLEELFSAPGSAALETLRERAGGCRVTLIDVAARSLAVDFFLSIGRAAAPSSDAGWTCSSSILVDPRVTAPFLLPGIACRSATPIPPGEYVVKVELPSGKVVEGSVTIAHGRTTSLVLAP
jgi:hypothetical protein